MGGDQAEARTLASRRALVRRDLEFLNELAKTLLPQQVRSMHHKLDYIIPEIKLALMLYNWDDQAWGDRAAFSAWMEQTGGLAEPQEPQLQAALSFYNAPPESGERR